MYVCRAVAFTEFMTSRSEDVWRVENEKLVKKTKERQCMCVRYGVFLPSVTLRRNHGIHQHGRVEKVFYPPASQQKYRPTSGKAHLCFIVISNGQ